MNAVPLWRVIRRTAEDGVGSESRIAEVERCELSRRQVAKRLITSVSQLYRWLDPANTSKSMDQLVGQSGLRRWAQVRYSLRAFGEIKAMATQSYFVDNDRQVSNQPSVCNGVMYRFCQSTTPLTPKIEIDSQADLISRHCEYSVVAGLSIF